MIILYLYEGVIYAMQTKIDVFNSNIFGINMANIILHEKNVSSDSLIKLINGARNSNINSLSVKIDTGEKFLTNIFLDKGFLLVDTQIMFSIALDTEHVIPMDGLSIDLCRPQDIPNIIKIAGYAFKIDQFHSNPFLDDGKCDNYYKQWAKNSCEGFADAVICLKKQDEVISFLTLHYDNKDATVGLAAVDTVYQGNGFFKQMMVETIYWLFQKGFKKLYYGTQLSNLPVLRTLVSLGGKPEFSKYVLNLML